MTYEIKLDIFEGPLDLLLFLIRKNEIDIYNIPIATITEQYLQHIEVMKALNLDICRGIPGDGLDADPHQVEDAAAGPMTRRMRIRRQEDPARGTGSSVAGIPGL